MLYDTENIEYLVTNDNNMSADLLWHVDLDKSDCRAFGDAYIEDMKLKGLTLVNVIVHTNHYQYVFRDDVKPELSA